ncbi:DUF721 domain-containing protein [Thalassovita taeanensis]|uniref:DUF721 domain-containing protein n=1 Tax=Thalassovita taeanensis TaxID=657014 RepID=A0A1H9CHK7_9RHOB|nr:DUF721 domain-containing protein [Thalassovita taeanensis]SEQ00695.1 hypothetical protein SAMN04488092_103264 [Thalassovita taeanensis]
MAYRPSTTKGFARTSALLQGQIRRAGETRGFAVTRLLTHWPEIVGEDMANIARPVDVKYGRQGFGATLTVLTTGAQAPMLEMQKEKLREKVNAVYGYSAISRIRITQTAPTGFAEGQASFTHRSRTPAPQAPDPQIARAATAVAAGIGDENLRDALEALAQNVLSKSKR